MKQAFLNILLVAMMLISSVSTAFAASGTDMVSNTTLQAPRAAGTIVVSSVNFDDTTLGTWTPSGSAVLSYIDDGSGGQALAIARAADYEGIQSPTGLLEAGIEYTFSMRARLPEGSSVTSTSIRFVVKPNYNWVGNATINNTGWTTLTGTYTLPEGVDPTAVQIYIGSDNQTGSYVILVDDILITRPEPTVTISSVNFNDSTLGTWTPSGSAVLAYVDDGSGGQALSITRAADYEGIQSPTGLLEAGIEYTFSMRARLPEGSSIASTSIRFVVKPNYNWVGNTAINNTGWTTLTGTYTLPEGVDPTAVQIYIGSDNQTGAYAILIDDILITAPDTGTVLDTDFESGLDGWVPRDAQGTPTVELTETQSHSPTHAALVSNRTGQGDGIGHDVTGILEPGTTYIITAWVRMTTESDAIWLSVQRTNEGADSFDTLGQFDGITSDAWEQVTATYQMGPAETAFLYFETSYSSGTSNPFLVDDVLIQEEGGPSWDPSLTPLKDTTSFPVGVAIDSRETTGAYAGLSLHHFDQITPENHMKPEAWYDADKNFRIHPEAKLLMDFAAANGIRVYGHTLLWHQQTPDWFFQHDDGTDLTNSPEDQAILSTRLHDHIFNVAQTLSSMYGPFGSDTNPLVAFDVVNEVISDAATVDGLRTSSYYNILGPSYIDDAFIWANQAFNVDYAAEGVTHPVVLAINDYNTEQSAKRARLHALVADLLSRDIPVDVVGHQFHASLSTPVQSFDEAITAFEDLAVQQLVSELDVMTGTPVNDAKRIEQGYFYRDAFRIFRAHADSLFSVTIWGLYDTRSWRSDNAPLLFNGQLTAKPAYIGAVDETLPARIRTALVFQADVPLAAGATSALEWQKLRLYNVGDKFSFQLRWEADHLSIFVDAQDATPEAADKLTFQVDGTPYTFNRDATGGVSGVVEEVTGGWKSVVHIPLSSAAQDDEVLFDIALTDGVDTLSWNDPGATGTLTLAEPLSYLEVAGIGASSAPVIDGSVDDIWAFANTVSTDKQTTGTDTAPADVKTLWKENTLYVLAHVHDDVLDDTASDPWQKDSIEIYVDSGNYKNGGYRPDDTQIRINYHNEISFGTGDAAAQQARLVSATSIVADGYIVEAAISLLEEGGVGTFHGLDFQVNDAAGGARLGIRNWADPTNAGYQSTAHWGVGQLLAANIAAPGKAPLVSPTGSTTTNTPAYTWDAVYGASWYYLWVNGPSGNVIKTWHSAAAVCSVDTCSVTPTTVLSTGAHHWWVRTWNSVGYGPWSDEMTFTVPAPILPGEATLTDPNGSIFTKTPIYTWTAASDATWYYLWVNGPSGNVIKQWYEASAVCTGASCSVTPTTALSVGAHTWWIQAWGPTGYGPWSDEMNFTVSMPEKTTLTAPTGSVTDTTPDYTWVAVNGATWYYMWVNGPSGNVIKQWYEASAVCTGDTCSVTPTTTLSAGSHTWWVQTWNTVGYGPWSDSMIFTVSP